jgi:cysteine desulfurase
VRAGIALEPLLHGGSQELGQRPGTENVLEIVGLGVACEKAKRDLHRNYAHLRELRDRLCTGLCGGLQNVRVNCDPNQAVPNTLSICFQGVDAHTLLAAIHHQVAASTGSACHSHDAKVSSVLRAMNVPLEWARGTIRLSVGRFTTQAEIDRAVEVITRAVRELRNR